MGFSTKEMHVVFFDQPTPKAFKDAFSPLSEASVAKLFSAVDRAIEIGGDKDVTMVTTFGSDVTLKEEILSSLVSFLETHGDVKRVAFTMVDTIVVVTNEGFIVTIHLIGSKKFVFEHKTVSSKTADDSFESVEDLTQKVLQIEHCTPRRK